MLGCTTFFCRRWSLVCPLFATLFPRCQLQDQILFDAAASLDLEQAAQHGGSGGAAPAAHRGFSSRARAIPIEALYQQAQAQGKRLVLCGE